MSKKNVWWIVGGVVVLAVVIFLLASAPGGNFGPGSSQDNALSPNGAGPNGSQNGGKVVYSGTGRVVFTVTDPTVSLRSVSQVNLKIAKIDIHNASAKDSLTGWTTVTTGAKTYDLLVLDNLHQTKAVSDLKVNAGSYDRIRFVIDSVTVKTKLGLMEKTFTAVLPADEIDVNSNFIVNNDTSNINFAFNAAASLFLAKGGEYIFAPVVKTDITSGATVAVKADGTAAVTGGALSSSISSGMDLDGSTRLNFALDPNAVLEIQGGVIKIVQSQS